MPTTHLWQAVYASQWTSLNMSVGMSLYSESKLNKLGPILNMSWGNLGLGTGAIEGWVL